MLRPDAMLGFDDVMLCFDDIVLCFDDVVLCFVRRRTSCFSLVIWLVCFAMRDVVLCSVTRSTQRRMK